MKSKAKTQIEKLQDIKDSLGELQLGFLQQVKINQSKKNQETIKKFNLQVFEKLREVCLILGVKDISKVEGAKMNSVDCLQLEESSFKFECDIGQDQDEIAKVFGSIIDLVTTIYQGKLDQLDIYDKDSRICDSFYRVKLEQKYRSGFNLTDEDVINTDEDVIKILDVEGKGEYNRAAVQLFLGIKRNISMLLFDRFINLLEKNEHLKADALFRDSKPLQKFIGECYENHMGSFLFSELVPRALQDLGEREKNAERASKAIIEVLNKNAIKLPTNQCILHNVLTAKYMIYFRGEDFYVNTATHVSYAYILFYNSSVEKVNQDLAMKIPDYYLEVLEYLTTKMNERDLQKTYKKGANNAIKEILPQLTSATKEWEEEISDSRKQYAKVMISAVGSGILVSLVSKKCFSILSEKTMFPDHMNLQWTASLVIGAAVGAAIYNCLNKGNIKES